MTNELCRSIFQDFKDFRQFLYCNAMTVEIDLFTGAGPATTHNVASAKWNLEDTQNGTTPVATPASTGTNFSFVKTFQVHITAAGGLTMTNIKVGKVTTEATTGTKLWHKTTDAAYTQATAAPASTGDNNVTAPAIPHSSTNASVTAVPLIGSAAVYAAGGFNAAGVAGNYVQMCAGVDATNTTAGSAVSMPTLRWQWTES